MEFEIYDNDNNKIDLSSATGALSSQYYNPDDLSLDYTASKAFDGVKGLVASSPSGLGSGYESDFSSNDMNGWSCKEITDCGTYGNICGGYKKTGKNDKIEKTFTGLTPGESYTITLDFIALDSWDGEKAIIKINDEECDWIVDGDTFDPKFKWIRQGKPGRVKICGNSHWPDQHVRVSCTKMITKSDATVVVTTKLNQGTKDESFAIDNVVFDKTGGNSNFFSTNKDDVVNNIGSWAEFTLPSEVAISKIVLYNRADGGYNTRLKGALIELIDINEYIQNATILTSELIQTITYTKEAKGVQVATTAMQTFDAFQAT
jgi:hypothetical protein